MLAILAGLTVVGVAWGTQLVPLPMVTGLGGAVTVLWYHPLLAACAVATTLGSPMPDQEAVSAVRLPWWNAALLAGLAALTGAVLAVVVAVGGGPHPATQLVGALLYWLALAVLSARLFGPVRSWLLPLVAYIPVTWWGFGTSPTLDDSRWWAVPAQPGGWSTLLAGAGCFLVAVTASTVTRPRLRWRGPGRRRTSVPGW